ncbi:MAG: TRAP transporter small permease subunit [Alphaproteobacteria bacterium]|nr:TRAP transporter small permease subunit [Alphaproteobacteria bacterium]
MQLFMCISRHIDAFNRRLGRAMSWAILAVVIVSSLNASVRYALNTSSNAWLELQWYLFSAVFLLGSAYTLQMNEHIRIDIVNAMLSRRWRSLIDIFGHVVFLLPLCSLMVWLSTPMAWRSFNSTGSISAADLIFLSTCLACLALLSLCVSYWPRRAESQSIKLRLALLSGLLLLALISLPFLARPIAAQWELSVSAGGLPIWPARFLIPLGFFTLLLQALSETIKRIAILRGDIPDPWLKPIAAEPQAP